MEDTALPRVHSCPETRRGKERGESRHGSQHATCSLELAWVGEWDATLKNGNAWIQILPLKKNSPERSSAENGMGHCVPLEAPNQGASSPSFSGPASPLCTSSSW